MGIRRHIKVGMWSGAPFIESINAAIDRLNNFLSKNKYNLDYEIIKLDPCDNKKVDIFFLDGGEDINPSLYGERPTFTAHFSKERDSAELNLLGYYRERNTFISGVCRGLQLISVYYGGSLFQDINKILNIDHSGSHGVKLVESERKEPDLKRFFPGDTFKVSSMHHQAIHYLPEQLYPTLIAEELSKDGGIKRIIEGIEDRYGLIRAVQSHPEFANFPETDGLLFSYLMRVDDYIRRNRKIESSKENPKIYLNTGTITTNWTDTGTFR
jgi:putative glutamine amidotransferase